MRYQGSKGSPDSKAVSVRFRPRKYFLKALKSVLFNERIADSCVKHRGVALVTALVCAEGGQVPADSDEKLQLSHLGELKSKRQNRVLLSCFLSFLFSFSCSG